jgi:hypothetical protein
MKKMFLMFTITLTFVLPAIGQCDPEVSAIKKQFQRATPEIRANMVLAQVAEVAQDQSLTSEQRAAALAVIPHIKASLYAEGTAKTSLDKSILDRVEAAFKDDPTKLTKPRPAATLYLAKQAALNVQMVQASSAFTTDCACSYAWRYKASPDCNSGMRCNDQMQPCVYWSFGCGTMWLYGCDAMCGDATPPFPRP